ncbi:MAG: carbamoyl-phosphate synthase large subunit, partial [Oscillospiraceae bacterium]
MKKFDDKSTRELLNYIVDGTDDRLFAIAQLIRKGTDLGLINTKTKIDMFFLYKIRNIVLFEKELAENIKDEDTLKAAKRLGVSDEYIGMCWDMSESEVFVVRKNLGVMPVYKMIDTCASE